MTQTFTLGGAPQPRFYGFSCQNERIPFLRSVNHSGPSLPRLTGWVGLRRRSKLTRSVLSLGAEPEPGNTSEGREGRSGENPLGKMLDVVKDGYEKGASLVAQPIIAGAMRAIQEGKKEKESVPESEQKTLDDRPPQVMKAGEDLANAIRKMGASGTDPANSPLSRVTTLANKGYKLSAVVAARSVIALGGKSVEEVIRTKQDAAQVHKEKDELEESPPHVLAAVQHGEKQVSSQATVLEMEAGSAENTVETVSEEPKVLEDQTPVVAVATDQDESSEVEGGNTAKEISSDPVDSAPGLLETHSRFAAMATDDEELSDSPAQGLAKDMFEVSSESANSEPELVKKPNQFAAMTADEEEPSDSPAEGLEKDTFKSSSELVDSMLETIEKPAQFTAVTTEEEKSSDSPVEDLAKDMLAASSEAAHVTPDLVKNPTSFTAVTAEEEESSDSTTEGLTKDMLKASSEFADSTPEVVNKADQFAAMTPEEEKPLDTVEESPAQSILEASSDTVEATPETVEKIDRFAAMASDQDEPSDAVEENLAQSILEASSDTVKATAESAETPDRFAAVTTDENESLKEGDETVQASVAASVGKDKAPSNRVFEAGIVDFEPEPKSELVQPRLEASFEPETGQDPVADPEFSDVLAIEGGAGDVPSEDSHSTGAELPSDANGGEDSGKKVEEPEEVETVDALKDEELGDSEKQTVAEAEESVGGKDMDTGEQNVAPSSRVSEPSADVEAKSEEPEENEEEEKQVPEPEVATEGTIVEAHSATHNGAVGNHEGGFSGGEPEKKDEQTKKKDGHKAEEESTDSVFAKAVNAGIEVADGASAEDSQKEESDESEESEESGESKGTSEETTSKKDPEDKATDDSSPKQPTKSALQVSAIRRDLKAEPPVNIVRPEKGEKYDRTRRGPALGGLGGLQYIRSYAESGKGPEVVKGEKSNQYFTPPKILMGKEVNSGKVEASTGSDAVTRTQQIQDIGTIWWQHGDDSGGGGGGGGGGDGHGGHGGAGEGGWWLQVLISLLMITGVVFAVLKAVLKPKERNAVNNG